jgi:hypothetical protein
MKRAGKIGRNEPCPCGSGRKYKKCHLDRELAQPIPYYELANELLRLRIGDKKCLHPMPGNAQCTGKVIEAHSISRNAALTRIALNQKVYQLDISPHTIAKSKGQPNLKLQYIKSATTFTGFCSPHDAVLFKPIDQGGLTPTPEQALLLHYRSLCRELYVQRALARSGSWQIDRTSGVCSRASVGKESVNRGHAQTARKRQGNLRSGFEY